MIKLQKDQLSKLFTCVCEVPNGNTWLSKWVKYKIYTSSVLVLCNDDGLSNEKGNERHLSK